MPDSANAWQFWRVEAENSVTCTPERHNLVRRTQPTPGGLSFHHDSAVFITELPAWRAGIDGHFRGDLFDPDRALAISFQDDAATLARLVARGHPDWTVALARAVRLLLHLGDDVAHLERLAAGIPKPVHVPTSGCGCTYGRIADRWRVPSPCIRDRDANETKSRSK